MIRNAPVTAGLMSLLLLLSGCGGGGSGGGAENPPDVAGVIDIESGTRVDSDTADDFRLDQSVDNGSPGSAQALPSGATVGGYLSFIEGTYDTGTPDQFDFVTDTADFFVTELSPGDRVAVQMFLSPDQRLPLPDRTLRILKQEGGDLVPKYSDTASDTLRALMVTLPADAETGSYLIEVSTAGGIPFRYVLTLADQASPSVMNTSYTDPAFMVDEAILSFDADPGSVAMAAAMAVSERRNLGRGAWLMRRDSARNLATMSARQVEDAREDTLDWIRELREQPGVAAAEPNYLYTSQQVAPDDDPLYDRQWNLPLTRAPMAWQAAPDAGLGIGIAVFDTGVFRSPPTTGGAWHPDLDENVRLISGEIMDYVSGDLDIDQEPGRDTNPADPGDGKTRSSNFHGTHVAGVAAAVDNVQGIVGMASGASIYPVRVLGRDGVGSSADLIAAVNWAAGRSEIDVINLSLGGLGPSNALKSAIDAAWAGGNGQLIVAAAGNQGTDEPTYPAAYPNVIGVGAVDGAGKRASYSNVGESVDVVAPGGDASRDANQDGTADVIVSTWGRDDSGSFEPGYAGLQGTSMAAPHVAGVYALMKGESTITPGEFRSLLRSGALTEEVGPAFEYGAGLINALAAMDAALDGNFPITLGASPSALQFNSAVLSAELEFSAYPEGEPITIIQVTAGAEWLNLGERPADLSQSLVVSVDTSGLENNKRYTTELEIEYDPQNGEAGTLTVPVSLRLGTSADERDAGRHYVLLVSADDNRDTIEQVVASASGGQYRFAFDQVEPGEYFLVAGTDIDNNGLICENGEACAEYPVNGLPEKIVIGDQPLSGVRLSTSFRRPTIAAMGLPRIGFEGYRLKSDGEKEQDNVPIRRLENDR
ncbi:S8 family serine peptidase [Marinobacter sp. SS13-12]|uniref:S8 family serine peptidase n=1 Tax=Marinobacter sp. SS13-12 TaxID=3050451 RepID=UPI0025562CDC|nr:S8 family serine peptidase [Marinobacter sp. SS13-12]MDK8463702.1 S8 family serine peptidase [Marinobacter sp. SS13-12]